MGRAGDDEQLLVAHDLALALNVHSGHLLKGILAEVAAVRLIAVDEQHRALNLIGPRQQRLVHERLAPDDVPAVGRVAAALVAN